MTDEEKVDVIIDAMARLYEIETKVKDAVGELEELSIEISQNS